MALPLIAAAKGAAGAATGGKSLGASYVAGKRAQGASMMHSSSLADRKTGSKMMKFDLDGKSAKNIDNMVKKFDLAIGFIGKISKTTAKILGTLAKSSPALAQQMVVLNKAFKLFLRPIGDILARWVTPMARWLIRVAMRWYQLFGGRGGKSDVRDEIEQLEAQKQLAIDEGRFDAADEIQRQIDEKMSEIPTAWDNFKNTLIKTGDYIWGLLTGRQIWGILENVAIWLWDQVFLPMWNDLKNVGLWIWEQILEPAWNFLSNVGVWIWDKILEPAFSFLDSVGQWIWEKILEPAFSFLGDVGQRIWENFIEPWFSPMIAWTERMWKKYIDPWLSPVVNWASRIWTDYIHAGFKGLANWGSRVWELIKSAASRLIPGSGFISRGVEVAGNVWDRIRNKAVGGNIDRTGLYNLHAGERVVTAGDLSRMKGSGSVNITNRISINANVNNDYDIHSLAKKLAEYNEVEMRRRVSYG